MGAASFGIFDARAAHVRKGFGGIVLPSASSINDRGVALAQLSCVVAGVLLQQTVAGVLPREQRDADRIALVRAKEAHAGVALERDRLKRQVAAHKRAARSAASTATWKGAPATRPRACGAATAPGGSPSRQTPARRRSRAPPREWVGI